VTIVLDFATPSQNTYQRWHWGRQSSFKDSVQMLIRGKLAEQGIVTNGRPHHRTKLTICRFSAGRLDRGNFVGGCKPILDALRDEHVIRDDNETWLDDRYQQHKAPVGKPRTEIVIEPLEVPQ
jgi:Holliday junction resolvase RusA-like endonuclease